MVSIVSYSKLKESSNNSYSGNGFKNSKTTTIFNTVKKIPKHTLWGQEFDATQNVSGDLNDVKNINATGNYISTGNLSITGDSSVGSDSYIGGDSSVSKNSYISKDTYIGGSLTVGTTNPDSTDPVARINFERNLMNFMRANGYTFDNDVQISGDLDVARTGTFNTVDSSTINSTNINNADTIKTKNLNVTGSAHFFELIIDKIKAAGGAVIFSPADGFRVDSVEKLSNGDYKLYWEAKSADGTSQRDNMWKVGDQAICMSFNQAKVGTSHNVSNKYYWCKVTDTNAADKTVDLDKNGTQYNYIVISSTDCDGTVNPEVGDEIAMLGSRDSTDKARQSAIYISAYSSIDKGLTAPLIATYRGIDNFDLESHRSSYSDANGTVIVGSLYVDANTSVEDYVKNYVTNHGSSSGGASSNVPVTYSLNLLSNSVIKNDSDTVQISLTMSTENGLFDVGTSSFSPYSIKGYITGANSNTNQTQEIICIEENQFGVQTSSSHLVLKKSYTLSELKDWLKSHSSYTTFKKVRFVLCNSKNDVVDSVVVSMQEDTTPTIDIPTTYSISVYQADEYITTHITKTDKDGSKEVKQTESISPYKVEYWIVSSDSTGKTTNSYQDSNLTATGGLQVVYLSTLRNYLANVNKDGILVGVRVLLKNSSDVTIDSAYADYRYLYDFNSKTIDDPDNPTTTTDSNVVAKIIPLTEYAIVDINIKKDNTVESNLNINFRYEVSEVKDGKQTMVDLVNSKEYSLEYYSVTGDNTKGTTHTFGTETNYIKSVSNTKYQTDYINTPQASQVYSFYITLYRTISGNKTLADARIVDVTLEHNAIFVVRDGLMASIQSNANQISSIIQDVSSITASVEDVSSNTKSQIKLLSDSIDSTVESKMNDYTYSKSEIDQKADEIKSTVEDTSKGIHSVIDQKADEIYAGVANTGIDITDGNIILDSDNTKITGNLQVQGDNNGFTLFDASGNAKTKIIANSVGEDPTNIDNVTTFKWNESVDMASYEGQTISSSKYIKFPSSVLGKKAYKRATSFGRGTRASSGSSVQYTTTPIKISKSPFVIKKGSTIDMYIATKKPSYLTWGSSDKNMDVLDFVKVCTADASGNIIKNLGHMPAFHVNAGNYSLNKNDVYEAHTKLTTYLDLTIKEDCSYIVFDIYNAPFLIAASGGDRVWSDYPLSTRQSYLKDWRLTMNVDIQDGDHSSITTIGTDGFYSVADQDKYFFMNTKGITMRWGNEGIKLDDNGIHQLYGSNSWMNISPKAHVKVLENTYMQADLNYDTYLLKGENCYLEVPTTMARDGYILTVIDKASNNGCIRFNNGRVINLNTSSYENMSEVTYNNRVYIELDGKTTWKFMYIAEENLWFEI